MIVKTFLIIAILSFVGKSKELMDFEHFDVDVIFGKYNLSCHIGINRYIQRKLYCDPADLNATDRAYKNKIDEIVTTYFNLLRVYYIPSYDNNNIMGTIIAPEMWTEYSHMLDWKSKNDESKILKIAKKMICCICGNCDWNSENNESDVHAMANKIICSIFDDDYTLKNNGSEVHSMANKVKVSNFDDDFTPSDENNGSEVHSMENEVIGPTFVDDFTLSDENIIRTYEHCRDTFSLLPTLSILMKYRLSNIFISHALNGTNDKLPVPMQYGFILLLAKAGEIKHFFNLDSTKQKIFIVDLMNQAIINTYDTIINIYNGLELINDEMWNILIEINKHLIDATLAVELFCYQVYQRQRSIEVDSSSDSPEQPKYHSELMDMYGIYIVNLEAILNGIHDEFLNDHPDSTSEAPEQPEYQSEHMKTYSIYIKNLEVKLKEGRLGDDNNNLSKYRGRLVEYKKNKHTIRVPVMRYYRVQPEKEAYEILTINMNENEYYGLFMELRIWNSMIHNFTTGMVDEMFYSENVDINTLADNNYMPDIVNYFEIEKDKIIRQMWLI